MANRARAPNVPMWKRPKKDFLNNFLEVILQKPCNTHRHEYMEKLFKEYSKLLNRLYDITWFGSLYAYEKRKLTQTSITCSTIQIFLII
jgi:hypothetical protein